MSGRLKYQIEYTMLCITKFADAEFKAELDETFKALEAVDDVLTQSRRVRREQ